MTPTPTQGQNKRKFAAGERVWVEGRIGRELDGGDRYEVQLDTADGAQQPLRFEASRLHDPTIMSAGGSPTPRDR